MSRKDEAARLRAKAADLRSQADHLGAMGDEGALTLRMLANGFERDARRFSHTGVTDSQIKSNLTGGWKPRTS